MPQRANHFAAEHSLAFCKKCAYPLVGLPSHTCPECGQLFNPQNPRTFSRRAPRRAIWRWARGIIGLLSILVLLAGSCLAWLWRDWHGEQKAIAQLRDLKVPIRLKAIGPEVLGWVLGNRLGHLRNRVEELDVVHLNATEIASIDFKSLKSLEKLTLFNCDMDNGALAIVGDATALRELHLGTILNTMPPNLSFLSKLRYLRELDIGGIEVNDNELANISALTHLETLRVDATYLTDAGLERLKGLSALKELRLCQVPNAVARPHESDDLSSQAMMRSSTPVTPAAIEKLQRALRGLKVLEYNEKPQP